MLLNGLDFEVQQVKGQHDDFAGRVSGRTVHNAIIICIADTDGDVAAIRLTLEEATALRNYLSAVIS